MHWTYTRFFRRYLHRRILCSFREWVLFGLLALSLGFSGVLYHATLAYQNHYIQSLTAIYPEWFVPNKTNDASQFEAFGPRPEVFELTFQLRFKIAEDEPWHVLNHLHLRATDQEDLKRHFHHDWSENTLGISQKTQQRLTTQDGRPFTHIWVARPNQNLLKLKLVPLEIPTDDSWLLISNETAAKWQQPANIFRLTQMSGDKNQDRTPTLADMPVVHWKDRLPFTHRAALSLIELTARLFSTTLLLLTFSLGAVLCYDLFRDTRRYTELCLVMGVSALRIQWGFIAALLVYQCLLFGAVWFFFQLLLMWAAPWVEFLGNGSLVRLPHAYSWIAFTVALLSCVGIAQQVHVIANQTGLRGGAA